MEKTRITVQAFLARLPLFNAMSPEELDRIACGTTELRMARGGHIFRRGDACRGFHLVVYGQVKLAAVSVHGTEKVIELVGPGHSFGEALMFMERPYIVSAQALADSMLLHVDQATVFQELDRDPGFARKMLAGMSRRMHSLICDLEANALRSGTERVIGYLLQDMLTGDGGLVRLPVSKAVVASRLNLTPEHFSRILADLSAHGLITVNGRVVAILDSAGLREYAG